MFKPKHLSVHIITNEAIAWHFPLSCNLQVIYKAKATIWKQNRQFTIGEVSKLLSKSKLPVAQELGTA